MSLHLNRQCQRADALSPPVRLVPGVGRPTKRGAKRRRSEVAAAAAVRGHIWEGPSIVNGFFQKIRNPSCHSARKASEIRGFSAIVRRSGYRSAAPPLRPRSARFGASPGRRSRRFPESRPTSTTGKWRIRRWVMVASAARIGVAAVDRHRRRAHPRVDRPVEHVRRHGRRRSATRSRSEKMPTIAVAVDHRQAPIRRSASSATASRTRVPAGTVATSLPLVERIAAMVMRRLLCRCWPMWR